MPNPWCLNTYCPFAGGNSSGFWGVWAAGINLRRLTRPWGSAGLELTASGALAFSCPNTTGPPLGVCGNWGCAGGGPATALLMTLLAYLITADSFPLVRVTLLAR